MGLTAFLTIAAVAILVGIALQYVSGDKLRHEWLVVALAGAFGAYFASESFPGSAAFSSITNWGPELDGLAIVPAIIGGALLAVVADIGLRAIPEVRFA